MSNSKISSNRLSIFVFNVIILILSFLVVTSYAVQPFWSVNAKIKLDKEQLVELIPLEEYPNANLDVALQNGIEFEASIEIPAELLWQTNTKMLAQLFQQGNLNPDMSEPVKALLDEQVDAIVDNLMPVLKNVALEIAKSIAVEQTKQSIFSALSSYGSEAEIQEKLNAYEFDDEWFNSQLDDLTTALQSGEKTAEEATEIVLDTFDNIKASLKETDDDAFSAIDNVDEDALRDAIQNGLAQFENEDGKINIEDAIASLLLGGLDALAPADDSALVTANPVSASVEPQQDSETVQELKANVKEKVYDLLPENITEIIATALKISAFVLVFSIFTWVYLIIKILFKLFFRDNSIKLKLPLWLGHLPGLLLWLTPTLIFQFVKGSAEMQMFTLHFASSGILAVVAVFILFVISIPYCSMRKALKRKKFRF
ncbi:MAG: hypothetical protein E7343_00860 [Clostridiales bacterium]|nr:hypothetical protein [Clostridiales bacterium]